MIFLISFLHKDKCENYYIINSNIDINNEQCDICSNKLFDEKNYMTALKDKYSQIMEMAKGTGIQFERS